MKVAIVTGTSSGVGLYTTIQFAKEKYKVIALMRPTSSSVELDEQLAKLSLTNEVEQIRLNMENIHEVKHTMEYIHGKYSQIDILVNNAGYAQGGIVELLPYDAWQKQFEANLWLTINMCKAVAPFMRKQRCGKIINLGSISGQIGLPAYAPYAMSKFALAGFSESLRFELLPFNVYVVLVEAGAYQTAIWKKGFEQLPINSIDDYDIIHHTMVKLTEKSAYTKKHPSSLASFIVALAKEKSPSLYQRATFGVKLAIILKLLISWRIYEFVMNKIVFKFRK